VEAYLRDTSGTSRLPLASPEEELRLPVPVRLVPQRRDVLREAGGPLVLRERVQQDGI